MTCIVSFRPKLGEKCPNNVSVKLGAHFRKVPVFVIKNSCSERRTSYYCPKSDRIKSKFTMFATVIIRKFSSITETHMLRLPR
jgi:hypothetical protein